MPRSSAVASGDSPVSQTCNPPSWGWHHGPDKVSWVVPCNCWTLEWWHNMPAAFERMPIPVMLSGRYPFGLGCLPVQATRWALQPALLTMQPSHSYWQMRVWAGTPAQQGHPLAPLHTRIPPLWGPVQVGPQGPPLQALTNLYSLEPRSHLPLWAVTSQWSRGLSLHWGSNCLPQKWPTSQVAQGWVSLPISWLHPQYGLPLEKSVLGGWLVEAFYSSLNGLSFLSACYFLTTGGWLIAPDYHFTHERQNGSTTLCLLLAWLPSLAPSGEYPLLFLGLPPGTLVVCLKSDQNGHRLPVSEHGILPEQAS